MFTRLSSLGSLLLLTLAPSVAVGADNPFVGSWALTLSRGGAVWLGVTDNGGQLEAKVMWIAGSVEPTESAKVEGDKLVITRKHNFERKDASGKKTSGSVTETLTATVQGDEMHLSSVRPHEQGTGETRSEATGRRQPPIPPAPDLAKIKFGGPIELFNGHDLSGWRLTDPHAVSGWSVKDGLLVNNPVQHDGKPHINYGNLRTDREFEDFNLKVEVRVGKGQNSGVYVRGMYEVQVADTYGRGLNPHNMGAVYSRITPTAAAEKPPGEWQSVDITFVDRHMTVVLNGQKIIDNQPVEGCTGGALWSDVTRPGPIYLQGDHTGIEYRSLVLRPAEK